MARNGIQKILLQELQEIKTELKEVRQVDIPDLRVQMEGFTKEFHEKLKAVQSKQTWFSSIATVLGGALAVVISTFTGHK